MVSNSGGNVPSRAGQRIKMCIRDSYVLVFLWYRKEMLKRNAEYEKALHPETAAE